MGWTKVTAPPQPFLPNICSRLIPVSVSFHDPIFALFICVWGCGCALEPGDSSFCVFLCQLCPLCATTSLLCMMRTKSSGMHQTRSSRWMKNHPSGSIIAWGKRKHLENEIYFFPEGAGKQHQKQQLAWHSLEERWAAGGSNISWVLCIFGI